VAHDPTDRKPAEKPVNPVDGPDDDAVCDVCGSDRINWRNCKLICLNCGTILKSCADL
jgi:hypothetical protein